MKDLRLSGMPDASSSEAELEEAFSATEALATPHGLLLLA
jgi:hypothetical protein